MACAVNLTKPCIDQSGAFIVGQPMQKFGQVLPRFELGSQDSES